MLLREVPVRPKPQWGGKLSAVLVLGTLAAVTVPAFLFERRTRCGGRRREVSFLRGVEDRARAYFDRYGELPSASKVGLDGWVAGTLVSYESDGHTASARLVRDADGDGNPATWTLTLAAHDRSWTSTVTPPPRGVY